MPIYFMNFLNKTGVSEVFDPYWAASSLTLWRLVVSAIVIMLASKVPRRPLFLVAGSMTAMGWFLLGLCTYLNENDTLQDLYPLVPWLSFVSAGIIMTGYSSGIVMVIFMLLGELLPSNLRGLGSGLVLFSNQVSWFLMVFTFPLLEATFGLDVLFFIFSGVTIFVVVFAYFFVPETFGLTLENIEEHYRNRNPEKMNVNKNNLKHRECLP